MEQESISRMEQKKIETRRRILETAEQLFILEGSYEQATIRELACKAGISVGAVYLHFRTKADILAALVARFIDTVSHLYDGLIPPNANGADKMEALLAFLDRLRNDKTFKLYIHFTTLNPVIIQEKRFAEHIHTQVLDFCSYIEGVIREGIADGSVSCKADPALASVTLIAMSFTFIGSIQATMSHSHAHLLEAPQGHFLRSPDDLFYCFQGFVRESFHITAKPAVSSS